MLLWKWDLWGFLKVSVTGAILLSKSSQCFGPGHAGDALAVNVPVKSNGGNAINLINLQNEFGDVVSYQHPK